ncbi:MAG: repeat containing protein, partial [Cyanobacteria bacterium RYN_339]|nr:repeat containing protein [Cyanobacteria bacterium RYN_339]
VFQYPTGLQIDGRGNLYVDDGVLRKVTPEGVVTTLLADGRFGDAGAPGAAAALETGNCFAVDAAGTIYMAELRDDNKQQIRMVSSVGQLGTLAVPGQDPAGPPGSNLPQALAVDATGNLYLTDFTAVIRKVAPDGSVTRLAGGGTGGKADGQGAVAAFAVPLAFSLDAGGTLYLADDSLIRKVTPDGVVSTVAGSGSTVKNGDAGTARFVSPLGVVGDAAGNLYVADTGNHLIRKVTPDGVVSTLAGGASEGTVDGQGASASFRSPVAIVMDAGGNLDVLDLAGVIRHVTPAGLVTTLAGTDLGPGVGGSADGQGPVAQFASPYGLAIDAAGNLYVADTDNNAIRKVSPTGLVTTLAGSHRKEGATDGQGPAASFNRPMGVAVDATGNLYVADSDRIRKVSPTGLVSTLAGGAKMPIVDGWAVNVDGQGAAASFYMATGIVVDPAGNLYVSDSNGGESYEIRKVTPGGLVSTVKTPFKLASPEGLWLDAQGNLYIADSGNNVVRKVLAGELR